MAEFQRSLQRFFLALNQLMESPLEGPTLLAQVGHGVLLGGLSSGVWWEGRCPGQALAVPVARRHSLCLFLG